jgi:hypothetical protein
MDSRFVESPPPNIIDVVMNKDLTHGWGIPPDAKVGDRIRVGHTLIEIIDEHTAAVVEDGD